MKVVFLDRDGTIIVEPPDEQVDSLEKLELIPGVIEGLRLLVEAEYQLVIVSNQDNMGSSAYPKEVYELVQKKMVQIFAGEGIHFASIFICPHTINDQCNCRKPKTGLIKDFVERNSVDISNSYVIGDRETDVQFARNIGCTAIQLTSNHQTQAEYASPKFLELCNYILSNERSVKINRSTKETDVGVAVMLNGSGHYDISTGLGFFDHMLAQLSKHSSIDMVIKVSGDLKVDEHHTVEDTGLVLGEALRKALGNKRGIRRYGFSAPMDEALAQVALDIGGRSYCNFKASFRREYIGELPTELVEDFFRAFADGLRANIHISVTGRNDHHKIEAIFKSVAQALRQAVERKLGSSASPPSTKGML